MEISLDSLLVPEKEADISFPGMDNFVLTLCHVSRSELEKIRKGCMRTTIDRKTRQPVHEVDDDKFLERYVSSVIKGWKGLTISNLQELVLVDVSTLDPDSELPFNQGNAMTLMKNSSTFDSWVIEAVGDLENFT